MNSINFMNVKDIQDFDDGYGHSHQDSSVEGMMREMKGMTEGDKHEELMKAFHDTQMRAEREKQRQLDLISQQRKKRDEIDDSVYIIRTDKEVRQREAELQKQRYGWVEEQNKEEMTNQGDEVNPELQILKYT